jgi:diguanylate cyclase (GGDEF)-like protein
MSNQNQNSNPIATDMLENLEVEIFRVMRTLQKLKNRIGKDDLTGLYRRDEFFARLEQMLGGSQGADVAVIMLDIDNFKKLNDSEGHVAGDHVLQRVANVIQRCTKAGATTGRYGGEEFIVAHCGNEASAMALAEALRRQIEREVNVTVSVGVATARQANAEIRRMVGMADLALYQAKHLGKNRVNLAA